jgi:hypothetical protein
LGYEAVFVGIPYAHHVLDTVVNFLSIFLNGILIYLVCYYSDFREKTYKWLLLVSAVIDFCLSIFAMITQPVGFREYQCMITAPRPERLTKSEKK